VSDLIDTTEMYLRTVYELEEEGVVPLRARIAERLAQSGPTVSQTVARMERDGLLTVQGDRHLELTPQGRAVAVRVMRKHRLAERLLVDVIGLDWAQVHEEACRWEHVMSEAVERRLVDILGTPTESPYGNPIPGLGELAGEGPAAVGDGRIGPDLLPLGAPGTHGTVVVHRIGEPLQTHVSTMELLALAGVRPGATVAVQDVAGVVSVGAEGHEVATLPREIAAHIYVTSA
jgi:DtxR family transcriptional regulator, Mn-dependent transcriptional regulator